jgi:long-chain acyl-CoA synthetase
MHPTIFAKSTPDKAALIMAETGEKLTYRQLDAVSNQGAQLFRRLGLQAGDVVAIFMENNLLYLPICWAAQRAGLYYTCISSRLTAGEVEYILRDCGAKVLIVSHGLSGVAGELAGLEIERLMVGGTAAGYRSWEEAASEMPGTPIADESAGVDMLYSSGTTGRPKGVRQPLQGMPIDAPNPLLFLVQGLFGFSADTIYLSPAPLYHAAPLRYCMTVHRGGGTVVVMEHFDAETALEYIEQYKANASQFVPTMFVRMLKLPDEVRLKHDTSTMKSVIHAAAPCPVDVKRRMIEWWGPVIHEYYGGTEGNGLTYASSADWLAHPGTVGKAIFGELHVCGENGEELGAGEEGLVYFGGASTFQYHNDPEKTAQSRHPTNKDWSTLGDVGKLDADGFLHLTDRKAFMIISGGVNIYPQEAENLLINHPKVMDCAVFGVPNEEFGEEVKAVVQPRDMSDAGPQLAEELLAYCRQNLSTLKCPRTIDFEAELPRHPTGKLYKRLLRERYWAGYNSLVI